MHDIRYIRENPKDFDEALKRRGLGAESDEILKMDEKHRQAITELQELQNKRNTLSNEIGEIKKNKGDATAQMNEVASLKEKMTNLEDETHKYSDEINQLLLELPNILDSEVPDGEDESANQELRDVGKKPSFSFTPKDHVAIGETLGMMDFELAAKLSGARFVVLRKDLAKLERALAAFMLDIHCEEFGYEEILPPSLVTRNTMQGTGQLPKFADDLFTTIDNRWLIPTAEVPLTNLVADTIIDASELPLRFTAYTPCFRAEAGAAGRDTRGMIRQHQFSKVELVSVVAPQDSAKELDRMTACAETILKKLELPYRVMFLCSGDTGFSARRTYDIEVWLPGQNEGTQNKGDGAYREISSCSNCGDFQARRMGARFRSPSEKETQFVHTLNGSGLAIGRTMIAVLENYQQEDGSVAIPKALQPYMGGAKAIKP